MKKQNAREEARHRLEMESIRVVTQNTLIDSYLKLQACIKNHEQGQGKGKGQGQHQDQDQDMAFNMDIADNNNNGKGDSKEKGTDADEHEHEHEREHGHDDQNLNIQQKLIQLKSDVADRLFGSY